MYSNRISRYSILYAIARSAVCTLYVKIRLTCIVNTSRRAIVKVLLSLEDSDGRKLRGIIVASPSPGDRGRSLDIELSLPLSLNRGGSQLSVAYLRRRRQRCRDSEQRLSISHHEGTLPCKLMLSELL